MQVLRLPTALVLALLFAAPSLARPADPPAPDPRVEASGNLPPQPPLLVAPADGAVDVPTAAALEVLVTDPEADTLTVTFLGRRIEPPPADFTIVALPDTQFYSQAYPATFTAQTQWILDTRTALNTVFVTHLGDIVQNLDYFEEEWIRADTSMSLLEGVLPHGLAVGNHDMHPDGQGIYFDQFFPATRYEPFPWYGGHDNDNKNSYQLFSVGSLDFIVLHLEYDVPGERLDWADGVLQMFSHRRAIISTHLYLDDTGSRPVVPYNRPDGTSAEEVWQRLVAPNCNVFLVLNGHYGGESRLTSINDCGLPVHQIMQDYQGRPNGGDGWLRYFTFRPSQDRIDVFTYTPTLDLFESDPDSQFSLDYVMGAGPFSVVDVAGGVASGSSASTLWEGRSPGARYDWYVTVADVQQTTAGPTWSFTTQSSCPSPATDDQTCDGRDDDCDGDADEDYVAPASECGVGACAGNAGRLLCEAGGFVDTCNPVDGARPDESCDGLDDDCDGATDEAWMSVPTTCGVGACTAAGMTTCSGGVPGDTCTPGTPAPDDATCNGVDDDCDGSVDEEYAIPPTTCGVGACAGNTGDLLCVLGATVDTCNPLAGATGEICDGVDNDCDGGTDEGDPGGGFSCGSGDPDTCTFMATACSGGTLTCESQAGPAPEVASDLVFIDSRTLDWSLSGAASSYALYRGTHGNVPWAFDHTCLQAMLAGPPADDPQTPSPGTMHYYLLSGRNACGEGTVGRTASGADRPAATPCP